MVKFPAQKSSKVISNTVIFFFNSLFGPNLALENTDSCGRGRSLASRGSFDSDAVLFRGLNYQTTVGS